MNIKKRSFSGVVKLVTKLVVRSVGKLRIKFQNKLNPEVINRIALDTHVIIIAIIKKAFKKVLHLNCLSHRSTDQFCHKLHNTAFPIKDLLLNVNFKFISFIKKVPEPKIIFWIYWFNEIKNIYINYLFFYIELFSLEYLEILNFGFSQ